MTQITLRQAHKLVEKINARLGTISINPNVSMNIWEVTDAVEAITTASDNFKAEVERQMKLVLARSSIRDGIRTANQQAVDALVAQRKRALDVISTLRHISTSVSSRGVSDAKALELKILAARESAKGATSYGSTDEVSVNLLTDEQVKSLDKDIQAKQLEIERIEDELTTANATGKLSLNDELIAILRDEGLI